MIGLLNLTDPDLAMQQMRHDRGPDSAPPISVQPLWQVSDTSPTTTIACSVGAISGFLVGALVTSLYRLRKRSAIQKPSL